MITAVDTNILLDILIPNQTFADISLAALNEASAEGLLLICDVVYSELCIHFDNQRDCDHFLSDSQIRVEPLTRNAHFKASRAFRMYKKQGGKRDRMLADFLIGAHATEAAGQLLSRDRGFYRELFPSLKVIDPSKPSPTPRASRHRS